MIFSPWTSFRASGRWIQWLANSSTAPIQWRTQPEPARRSVWQLSHCAPSAITKNKDISEDLRQKIRASELLRNTLVSNRRHLSMRVAHHNGNGATWEFSAEMVWQVSKCLCCECGSDTHVHQSFLGEFRGDEADGSLHVVRGLTHRHSGAAGRRHVVRVAPQSRVVLAVQRRVRPAVWHDYSSTRTGTQGDSQACRNKYKGCWNLGLFVSQELGPSSMCFNPHVPRTIKLVLSNTRSVWRSEPGLLGASNLDGKFQLALVLFFFSKPQGHLCNSPPTVLPCMKAALMSCSDRAVLLFILYRCWGSVLLGWRGTTLRPEKGKSTAGFFSAKTHIAVCKLHTTHEFAFVPSWAKELNCHWNVWQFVHSVPD